jgi:hypothetical protein
LSETLARHHPATQDILNLTAASLSAAPNLTETERQTRSETVVRGTMAFQPADPTQTMLASLILGHHLAIMDGFRDIACLTLTPAEAARARMVTVAQTKLVLQLARELRIARKEALPQTTAEPGKPAPEPAGDTGYEASIAKLLSVYTDSLARLENSDTLTPGAAEKARQALSQALPQPPGAAPREANPVIGSRAQRRATMKRRGEFKKTA